MCRTRQTSRIAGSRRPRQAASRSGVVAGHRRRRGRHEAVGGPVGVDVLVVPGGGRCPGSRRRGSAGAGAVPGRRPRRGRRDRRSCRRWRARPARRRLWPPDEPKSGGQAVTRAMKTPTRRRSSGRRCRASRRGSSREAALGDVGRGHPGEDDRLGRPVDDVVLGRAQVEQRRGDLGQVGDDRRPRLHERVDRLERRAVVAALGDAGLLDVVGDPGERRHHVLEHRQQLDVEAPRGDRRVDHHDPGDPVGVLLGEAQRERATHREAADDDRVVVEAQLVEGASDLAVPVVPRQVLSSCQVVP